MEEIQDRSHDYLQQEEGQTAVKTDRNKKDNPRKEHFREDRGRKENRSNRSYRTGTGMMKEGSDSDRIARRPKLRDGGMSPRSAAHTAKSQ
ncbi:hypothetical protein PIB30_082333 [Stylosanthes scabra]|uniref:Uncharacterized protein n=1 Tax=Stylosanthes scabra TaxID=79078 RepID=A0ABU6VRM6_9FABA|nr:hypothetical protein [Stylosanthes scabra]